MDLLKENFETRKGKEGRMTLGDDTSKLTNLEEGRVEVINLWSGPRSLSTSLMYSFAQVPSPLLSVVADNSLALFLVHHRLLDVYRAVMRYFIGRDWIKYDSRFVSFLLSIFVPANPDSNVDK